MTVEAHTSAKMINFDNRKENKTIKKQALFSILCTILLLSGGWMHAEESEDYVPAPIRVVSTDLPPRTSPPSMLDPGPFEVHSKG